MLNGSHLKNNAKWQLFCMRIEHAQVHVQAKNNQTQLESEIVLLVVLRKQKGLPDLTISFLLDSIDKWSSQCQNGANPQVIIFVWICNMAWFMVQSLLFALNLILTFLCRSRMSVDPVAEIMLTCWILIQPDSLFFFNSVSFWQSIHTQVAVSCFPFSINCVTGPLRVCCCTVHRDDSYHFVACHCSQQNLS